MTTIPCPTCGTLDTAQTAQTLLTKIYLCRECHATFTVPQTQPIHLTLPVINYLPSNAQPAGRVTAILLAKTDEARHALGDLRQVEITEFPFRVGRERRRGRRHLLAADEPRRRARITPPLNDLYLVDPHEPWHISPEHFLIDHRDTTFYLTERGSTEGTIVAGRWLGNGSETGRTLELHDGEEIIVGTQRSPFRFIFEIADGVAWFESSKTLECRRNDNAESQTTPLAV